MTRPRILILGATGQVGWELQRSLATLGELHAWDFPAIPDADFSQPERVVAAVERLQPDWVVNAAAYTAVDRAESEPELARVINATTPTRLAAWCAKNDRLLVHYSTDYVFDGSGEHPRDEDAPAAPGNVYGSTKLEGEQAIRESAARTWLLRTSWVYAAHGRNFLKTALRLAETRDDVGIVADQFGAPTGAELIADVTARILGSGQQPDATELLHVAARGETSWHGFACEVVAAAERAGRRLRIAPDAIRRLTTDEYPTPALRPRNSRLDCSRLERCFGLHLPDWEVGVRRVVAELLEDDGFSPPKPEQ